MTLSEYFASNPTLFIMLASLLGLLVGSFLNVVIYRLPLMMERDWRTQCYEFLELPTPTDTNAFSTFNLSKPDSHCPQCKHAISASENIPVISFLIQGGKCKHCKAKISWRYPLLEATTAALSGLIAFQFGVTWLCLALLFFTWILVALTMIDVDHQLLPDDLTLPLLWLGLLINTQNTLVPLQDAVLGAIAGYLVLWAVYWAFKLLTGKEGMGYGDFKLLAALGAWLGWQALPVIILLSSVVGAVVGISLIAIKGRDKNIPIPFGPYLATAGFLALLGGERLSALLFSFTV
jgi:leader peptidase (prepilin peptidase)/N-methyltransferase